MKKEYITPEMNVVDVRTEGLLCNSKLDVKGAGFEDWLEDEFLW